MKISKNHCIIYIVLFMCTLLSCKKESDFSNIENHIDISFDYSFLSSIKNYSNIIDKNKINYSLVIANNISTQQKKSYIVSNNFGKFNVGLINDNVVHVNLICDTTNLKCNEDKITCDFKLNFDLDSSKKKPQNQSDSVGLSDNPQPPTVQIKQISEITPIYFIRPEVNPPCLSIPYCYSQNMEIEWNPDLSNKEGVILVAAWQGLKVKGQYGTNDAGVHIHPIYNMCLIPDNGVYTIENSMFAYMPEGAIVTLILVRADIINIPLGESEEIKALEEYIVKIYDNLLPLDSGAIELINDFAHVALVTMSMMNIVLVNTLPQ